MNVLEWSGYTHRASETNEYIYSENISTFSIDFFVAQQSEYDQMAHLNGKTMFVCASTTIRLESKTNGESQNAVNSVALMNSSASIDLPFLTYAEHDGL